MEQHSTRTSPSFQVGRRIALLRKRGPRGGMTQADLAFQLGISLSYVEKIERGERPASAEMLARITSVLGVDPLDLGCGRAVAVTPSQLAGFALLLERYHPRPAVVAQCLAVLEVLLDQFGGARNRLRARRTKVRV